MVPDIYSGQGYESDPKCPLTNEYMKERRGTRNAILLNYKR